MPSPLEDMINNLESNGSIAPNEVPKYMNNYFFFQDNIRMIEANYKGQWVAALNFTAIFTLTKQRLLAVDLAFDRR